MLSQLRALWSAVWRCFQRSLVFGDKAHLPHAELAMPMCPRSWWNGGRQAPCSLVLWPSTSPLRPGTCQQWPTWEMFRGANASNQPIGDEHGVDVVFWCILQLPSTSPPSHCRSVPGPNGLVEGKHHVLWCWCLQPAHWGREHVSSDQHGRCSVELMPQTSRLVTNMESMLYSAVAFNQPT